MIVNVEVWVCPNPGCGNYYASSSMAGQDLTQKFNYDLKHNPTHSRAQCPNPNCQGTERVMRVTQVTV